MKTGHEHKNIEAKIVVSNLSTEDLVVVTLD